MPTAVASLPKLMVTVPLTYPFWNNSSNRSSSRGRGTSRDTRPDNDSRPSRWGQRTSSTAYLPSSEGRAAILGKMGLQAPQPDQSYCADRLSRHPFRVV